MCRLSAGGCGLLSGRRELAFFYCLLAVLVFLFYGSVQVQATPVKIMPLGASITVGEEWYHNDPYPDYMENHGGYRIGLWNRLQGSSMSDVDFVGSQSGPALGGYDDDHEGHSGYKIADISAEINGWLAASTPDIVLLHIGTNDRLDYDGKNADMIAAKLDALVGQIFTALPTTHIYLASLIGRGGSAQDFMLDYNGYIPGIVSKYQGLGDDITFVDMYNLSGLYYPNTQYFTMGADKLHPNATGYDRMAGVWFDALVPEPATCLLLIAGLSLIRRKS